MHYILDEEGQPKKELDPVKWSEWFSIADRHIKKTYIPNDSDEMIVVSTVFLGIDHNFFGGHPILYETMVFSGPLDEAQYRWDSRDNAEAGHEIIVQNVLDAIKCSN